MNYKFLGFLVFILTICSPNFSLAQFDQLLDESIVDTKVASTTKQILDYDSYLERVDNYVESEVEFRSMISESESIALSDSLIAWWPLNNFFTSTSSAIDVISAFNATNTSVSFNSGKFNNSAYFSGTGKLVAGDNVNLDGMEKFSISLWFKASANNTNMTFINKDNVINNRAYSLVKGSNGRIYFDVYNDAGEDGQRTSIALINDTLYWHHLVVTFDGDDGEINIYIDGVLNQNPQVLQYDGNVAVTSATFDIGYRPYSASYQYFIGYMDEIGFWDRVLTQDDVTLLYYDNDSRVYDFVFDDVGEPIATSTIFSIIDEYMGTSTVAYSLLFGLNYGIMLIVCILAVFLVTYFYNNGFNKR